MGTTSIGNLFGNIPSQINDELAPLEETAANGPYEKDLSIDSGSKSFDVFGTPIAIDATLTAKVQAGPITEVPFADDKVAVNGTYASLTIGAKVTATGSASGKDVSVQLSANASANAAFDYQHYLPVDGSRTRLAAFIDLAKTTDLPQLVNPASIADGEVLDVKTAFGVDFGLKATFGNDVNINGTFHLFDNITSGLSLPFTAHAALAVSAAFGFALSETTRYTVGRLGLTDDHPDWVRIRITRDNKERITFGIALNLTIDYDATSGAQMLLDKAFALIPTPEAIKTLEEISALASENWDDFKKKISDEAAVIIGRLVDDTGWKNLVAASPAINQLISAANKIVTLYNGIDNKVRSIFEELISKLNATELGKLQPIIQQVAAIDVNNINLASLLSQQEQEIVHWVEILSGENLEELIVTNNVKQAITRAVDLAQQIQKFLSGGGAEAAVGEVNAILNNTGAAALVAWLQKNAASVQTLQSAGEQAVGDIVRRLLGKALSAITPADVTRLQQFASKLNDALNAKDQLHDKLQKGIQKLKGSIGFNASLELTRVSEKSAILDVEIDTQDSHVMSAVKSALKAGDIRKFLAALNGIKPARPEAPAFPYLIREALLTSRHIRTTAMSTVVGFLGFTDQTLETKLVESSISIHGGGTSAPHRDATYNGGTSVRRFDGAVTSEGAAWIRIAATGPGTDTSAPYTSAKPALRLTYTRQDPKTDEQDIAALRGLFDDLSITTDLDKLTKDALQGKQSSLAMTFEFPDTAVAKLIAKDSLGWDKDARNAAHRWFSDPDRASDLESNSGQAMAKVVINPTFGNHWTDFLAPVTPGDSFFEADASGFDGIQIFNHSGGSKMIKPEFTALGHLLARRAFAARGFATYTADPQSTDPHTLVSAATQAARMFDTLESQWQPPLFNFWLVMARALRQSNGLQNVRGLITLRTRVDANDDWGTPSTWILDSVNADALKTKWFPL